MMEMKYFSPPKDDGAVCERRYCEGEKTHETRYEHGSQSSQTKHPDKRDLKEVAK